MTSSPCSCTSGYLICLRRRTIAGLHELTPAEMHLLMHRRDRRRARLGARHFRDDGEDSPAAGARGDRDQPPDRFGQARSRPYEPTETNSKECLPWPLAGMCCNAENGPLAGVLLPRVATSDLSQICDVAGRGFLSAFFARSTRLIDTGRRDAVTTFPL